MVLDRLDVLIQEILDGKNVSKTNRELRIQLASDLKQRLLGRINLAVIGALPEEKLIELDSLLNREGVSDEQIRRVIMSAGLDLRRIAVETMHRFKNEYLGVMSSGAVK